MMREIRFVLTSVVALALLVSCGNSMFDPMDPTLEGARLEIVGSPAVNLRFGEMADLRVRYVRMDGSPIENAPIDYVVVGTANGSRLAALQTPTDSNGEAAVGLTAGSDTAMFDVSVTPPVGDGVSFSVAVSDTDAGSIVVSMTYAGMRELVRFDTFLFDSESCAMMNPNSLPTALRSAPSVSNVAAMPAFAGVPVGSNYTVAVVASTATNVGAFGCRDGIAVTARAETPVAVTLMDVSIGPDFVGVWDLDNQLDFSGALPPSVDAFISALDELTDDSSLAGETIADTDGDRIFPEFGVDPGAFVTDLLMRQTCHWQCDETAVPAEDYASCSELNHPIGDLRFLYIQDFMTWNGAQSRVWGGCGGWEFVHEEVQTRINALAPDFLTDWLEVGGDLSRAITNAHILSVLTISGPMAGDEFALPMSHELVQMQVSIHDPTTDPPSVRDFTFALADAGFTSLEATEVTSVDGTTLSIPSHQFTLNWGELVLYIYRTVILPEIFGVATTGELFATWIDCASVGVTLSDAIRDFVPGGAGPSASTVEGYCDIALTAAGSALEGAISDFIDAEGTLTLQGTATGEGINMDTGRVDRLVNGMWTGSWGEDTSVESITGTFTGDRRTGM